MSQGPASLFQDGRLNTSCSLDIQTNTVLYIYIRASSMNRVLRKETIVLVICDKTVKNGTRSVPYPQGVEIRRTQE